MSWTTLLAWVTLPFEGFWGLVVGLALVVFATRWSRPYLVVVSRYDAAGRTHRIWIQNQDPFPVAGFAVDLLGQLTGARTYAFGGVGDWEPGVQDVAPPARVRVKAPRGLRSYGTWLVEIADGPLEVDLEVWGNTLRLGTDGVHHTIGQRLKPGELVVVVGIAVGVGMGFAVSRLGVTEENLAGVALGVLAFVGWVLLAIWVTRPPVARLTQGFHGWNVKRGSER